MSNCGLFSSAKGLWAVVVMMLVFTTVLVSLRIYARLVRIKAFGWDDATLLIAYALNIVALSFELDDLAHGFGQSVRCLTSAKIHRIKEYLTIAQFIGVYSGLFARLSTGILILRIFGLSKTMRFLIIGYTVVESLALGITGILIWFQCSPSSAIWDAQIPHTCWSSAGIQALNDTNGAFSVVGNFIVIAIPLYFMCYAKVPKSLKLVVISIFMVSLIPCACAIARMILHYTSASPIYTYQEPDIDVVFTLEFSMLVVCASLPTVPAVIKKISQSPGISNRIKPRVARRLAAARPPTNRGDTTTRSTAADNNSLDNLSKIQSEEDRVSTRATLSWTSEGFALE